MTIDEMAIKNIAGMIERKSFDFAYGWLQAMRVLVGCRQMLASSCKRIWKRLTGRMCLGKIMDKWQPEDLQSAGQVSHTFACLVEFGVLVVCGIALACIFIVQI